MSKEDKGKLILGLLLFGFVIFVMLFTIYMYAAHPKNREYLIKRLENARQINPIKESIDMLKKKKQEESE
ncbi:hypothetical protein [Aquifex sp.]